MKNRILHILFWSVLSAAFIGPGTITTAASAGTDFGYILLWALVFSTLACVVLQEASARLTAVSGKNLGQAIRHKMSTTLIGKITVYLILTAILLGCAAYEAGNILGGVAGAALILEIPTTVLALAMGSIAFFILLFGSTQTIAQILGGIVAVMGICFLTTAFITQPEWREILGSAFFPRMPTGSELLVIGLIGTTVVPYNLFLGSGLKHNQSLQEMRFSLTTAVVLGGLISIAVLVVGTTISGEFSFDKLADSLGTQLGSWASIFFGIGLAAAGISSALTAPLAGALTAQSMLGDENNKRWKSGGRYFRATWISILAVGIIFGVTQIQPVPAIIMAQALNGFILPVVAIFLLVMMNNRGMLKKAHINSHGYNILMGLIVFTTLIIGLTNMARALSQALDVTLVHEQYILLTSIAIALLAVWPVVKTIRMYRNN